MHKKILKLIKSFEKKHKEINGGDGDYFTDCPIMEQTITRTAPLSEWMGNKESWERSMKEQEFFDKNTTCQTCEFINKLKIALK